MLNFSGIFFVMFRGKSGLYIELNKEGSDYTTIGIDLKGLI